jgi:hypothetical protein
MGGRLRRYKDFTGKCDTMAQDSPFFFAAKEAV